jgi:hypothetical protein
VIDPVSIGLAIAGAKTIVNNVREVVKLGHDITSLTGELSGFFKTQATVEKAKVEAQQRANDPNADESATQLAFDMVMRAEEMKQAEQELRDLFSMTGRIDLYHELCAKREEIVGNRIALKKQQEMAESARQRKLQAKLQVVQVFTAIGLALVIACTLAWSIIWVLTSDQSPLNENTKVQRK